MSEHLPTHLRHPPPALPAAEGPAQGRQEARQAHADAGEAQATPEGDAGRPTQGQGPPEGAGPVGAGPDPTARAGGLLNNPPDERRCEARSKTTGERCQKWKVPGKRVCRFHGGLSPSGPAAGGFKHGGFSKFLPVQLRDAYERAGEDPELMSMRDELRLVRVRMEELAARLGTGEYGDLWGKLRSAWDEFMDATRRVPLDPPAITEAQGRVQALLDRGASVEAAWAELMRAVDRKGKVAAREWRRLSDLQQMMTAEQAMTLIAAIVASVRKHVEPLGAGGRQALAGISADLTALMHARAAAARVNK